MIAIKQTLNAEDFSVTFQKFWALSGKKIQAIERTFDSGKGAPVFTKNGIYTLQGWTDWDTGLSIWFGHLTV